MSEIWDNTSENIMDESEDYTEDMADDSFDEEIRNEEYECEICQQIFISTESLNNHIRLSHSVVDEEFKCVECGSIFLSQAHLVRHRKVHLGDKAIYRCEECNVSFRFKVSLHIHMRRHNNDFKKYECMVCDKYFISKDSLKKHLNEHYAPVTYQCDECGEEFDQKSEFNSHLLTHSDKDVSMRDNHPTGIPHNESKFPVDFINCFLALYGKQFVDFFSCIVSCLPESLVPGIFQWRRDGGQIITDCIGDDKITICKTLHQGAGTKPVGAMV